VAPVAPVVRVVRVAPVVPENQVEAELALVPVGAELALGQAVVRLRAKSVTAAHHPGLVPVPRVEDSAAVAETTREPAAAEAVRAWAAAE
jgi:hypothetical protein